MLMLSLYYKYLNKDMDCIICSSYKGVGAKRPGAKRLWGESTRSWAKRPGAKRLRGETSIGRIVQGRIVQVVGESSRGRNVEWAKRLAFKIFRVPHAKIEY